MPSKIETLKSWIEQAHRAVFFGGAGVSTESGIPDFRSVDGLYHQKFDYPPETIISRSFFDRRPEEFFKFYREKMLPLGFEPNVTHRVLARLEQEGHLAAVVTQNIDGLHQKAGSRRQRPAQPRYALRQGLSRDVHPRLSRRAALRLRRHRQARRRAL